MYFDRTGTKLNVRNALKARPVLSRLSLYFILLTTGIDLLVGLLLPSSDSQIVVDYSSTAAITSAAKALSKYLISTPGMISMFASILLTIYILVMRVGYRKCCLDYIRGRDDLTVGDLTYALTFAGKLIIAELIIWALIIALTCVFIFPGIIVFYMYRMTPYVLAEDPSTSVFQALRRSRQLTSGVKMTQFTTDLSFLGWFLVLIIASQVGANIGAYIGGFIGNATVTLILTNLVSFLAELPMATWLFPYFFATEAHVFQYALMRIAEPHIHTFNDGNGQNSNGPQGPWNRPDSDNHQEKPWD